MHAAINHASELQNAFALKYNNYYTLFHVYSLHQFLKYLEIHFSCMQSLNDTAGGTASSSKGSKIILIFEVK